MALYAIGDLHLSQSVEKPMDVFGEKWKDHAEKLKTGFAALGPEDVTVLCGDLSWAMGLQEAGEDFRFIQELPGQKIILKGNHDYWWSTAAKAQRFFAENGIDSIRILHNNCFAYGDYALCGTRGWFYEEETGTEHDAKVMRREVMRLEASLKAAGEREKLVFLHYPPKLLTAECGEMLAMMRDYGVKRCWYGHLHSGGCALAFEGEAGGIRFQLVSADHLHFFPQKIF
jgi:predicted phosphohydrolase